MGVFTDIMQDQTRKEVKAINQIENSIDKKERIKQHEKDKKQELKRSLQNYIFEYYEENKRRFFR